MRFSGALAGLVLVLGGWLLAGCSGGGRVAAAPARAAVAVAPARPSVAASPAPPAPRASATPFVSTSDMAGAFAFARAYFVELDRAFATGDVSALSLFREPTCSCIRMERHLAEIYAAGGRLVGAHHTIRGIRAGAHGPLYYEIGVLYDAAAVTNQLAGERVSVTAPLSAILVMDLVRRDARWVLRDARIRVLSR